MKKFSYYLQGFGFNTTKEYTTSTFGFMGSPKGITCSSILGVLSTFLQNHLGLPIVVFFAFVILNILEFYTGIKAARKKGFKIESRKMGRMFFKLGTYITIIWILNAFAKGIEIPPVLGVKLQPFVLLYWAFIAGVIYQLYKSLMENMEALGWKEAGKVLNFTKKKLNGQLGDDNIK